MKTIRSVDVGILCAGWMTKGAIAFYLVLGAAASAQVPTGPGGIRRFDIDDHAREQIALLQTEKQSRTAAQRKLDSQLCYALRQRNQAQIATGLTSLKPDLVFEPDGRLLVDIKAVVSEALLGFIRQQGGLVSSSSPQSEAVRALVPLDLVEKLSERADVRGIRPADRAVTWTAGMDPEGDIAHLANTARSTFLTDGTGIKIGVLSDSADYLSQVQAAGGLLGVIVLPGQAGSGTGEGTAMMEIVNSLAPGAQLYFATAFNGVASFAQNIRSLQAAGCRIIVDDVIYFNESPFQDGPIAQAVNDASAAGVLYFSAAGNGGGIDRNTSGTWEGDFLDGGSAAGIGRGGRLHDFGGSTFNTALPTPFFARADLFWSDPLGAATNDYDLYILNSSNSVVRASTNPQNGTSDPYEAVSVLNPGERVVVVKFSGAGRFLHLSTGRGLLTYATTGTTRGHNASGAANAFSIAATGVANPAVPFVGGTNNPVESFSSDGPRHIFFNPDGSAITPGNFSSTGGRILLKPDLTAADGVSTTVPGYSTFVGTSASAPHAAAIAALIWSFNPVLPPATLRTILTNTALDISPAGYDQDSGAGIVMAYPALNVSATALVQSTQLLDVNGKGALYADECANLVITLLNTSTGPLQGLTATLTCTDTNVIADPVPRSYPDLVPGAAAASTVPFRITTSSAFACGSSPVFRLQLSATNQGGLNLKQQFQLNSLALSVGSPISFTCTNVPLAIPDLGTAQSTITVQGMSQSLARVRVSAFITHTYDQDLRLSLRSPDGTEILLSSNNGLDGQNYGLSCQIPTVFSDDATNSIDTAFAPFAGTFAPEQPLATFNGKSNSAVNGVWTLRVQDQQAQDVGTIQCWSLELSPLACFDGGGQCPFPPQILQSPASQLVTNGTTAMFSVSASGSQPLSYQWFFQGTNALPGATNTSLVLSNVTAAVAGAYQVLVTNLYGVATSTPASLIVEVLPTIQCSTNRTVNAGSSWDFDVPAFTGQGASLSILSTVTNTTCGLGLSATRTWLASDTNGFQASCSQTIQVIDTNAPVFQCLSNKSVPFGANWTFDNPSAQESGTTPALIYDNLTNDLQQRFAPGGAEVGNEITLAGSARYLSQLNLDYWATNSQQPALAGAVSLRLRLYDNDGSTNATWGMTPGTVIYDSGPIAVSATAQGTLVLNQFQLGTQVPLNGALPTNLTWTVQWSGLGSNDAAGLRLFGPPDIGAVFAGYWLRTNGLWSWLTDATNSLGVQLLAVSQPVNLSVSSTVTNATCGNGFTATRVWQASDTCGHLASCSQTVQVLDQEPPLILSVQPTNQVATEGQSASFTANVFSCSALSYQWYFQGTNLLNGATNSTLVLSNVEPASAGLYLVTVTNAYGSATSAPVQLSVTAPLPTIQCSTNRTVNAGSSWDFDVPAFTGQGASLSILSTVTNTTCGLGLSATRTWLVSDTNGFQASCSQTIQVIDTSTPVMTCLPDKVVSVATNWNFDVPRVQESGPDVERVYDNATNDLALNYSPGDSEVGNEISLGGSARYLTHLAIGYWATNSQQAGLAGTVMIRVRLYDNDGSTNATTWGETPGTVIFDSGLIGVQASPQGTIALDDFQTGAQVPLSVPLPTNLTWTVQWIGLGSNDAAGLRVYGPPVVGSVSNGYWLRSSGFWNWLTDQTNSFEAQLSAVDLTALSTVTNADCGNGFSATRVWQASDACGHLANCSQTVQVIDQQAPVILSVQPSNQLAVAGQTVSFAANVFSCSALSYQWYFQGTNALDGATNATLTLNQITPNQGGLYQIVASNFFGFATSAPVELDLAVPAHIVASPGDQVATNGDTVQWSVTASGTGLLAFQWYFNGTNALPGATLSTLTLSNVSPAETGSYQVAVSNSYGSALSAPAQLLVLLSPSILTQPVDQTVQAGGTATFAVSATGIPSPYYQWFFNETNLLEGATGSVLTITNVEANSVGTYSVLVTNSVGATNSASALLTVLGGPAITSQPLDVTCFQGDTIFLSVDASGNAPLGYQWYASCLYPISGATDSLLRLKQVTSLNNGTYCVVVSNAFGHVFSRSATVRVLVKPSPISLVQTQSVVRLTFSSVTNQLYSVQYSDQFTPLPWPALTNATLLPGTGTSMTVIDPSPSKTNRFYRIIVQ